MNMYEELGVDPEKKNVKETFGKLNDQEYPTAFVNIISDPFCSDRALTQHQDGDGSKFIQRMLHYFETSDKKIFTGMVDDALSMNTGDIAASGFIFGPWLITNVLNLNLPEKLKEIIMEAVAVRLAELRELYSNHGFNIKFLGGETADLPDQVKSGVFDIAITAWANKKDLITGNIYNDDLIFGFPSDGQAAWETEPNSGLMSNGLTLARCCLMKKDYDKKYPSLKRDGEFYQGRFHPDSHSDILGEMSVGKALLSPTRQWAIVIKEIITALKEVNAVYMLHGITMNTGGGATKITNIGKGILYIKEMPAPPPLFRLIQSESKSPWVDMYKNLNNGIGLDVIGENNTIFIEALNKASIKCGLPLCRLGICQKLKDGTKNKVSLNTPFGSFTY